MFDFSGTLLRIESTKEWLGAVLTAAGATPLSGGEFTDRVQRLTRYGALPGGPAPLHVPRHLETLWRERDLSTDRHRAAYTALAREGLAPSEVLMVGDDRVADGGAEALGCAVHFVDHLPVDRRPDGLAPVLGLLG
ncbi:hypothetical protein ACQUSR_33045 [Streptomyces sp. P1-3]|uniref:hypothetical protein n=1 Tax=Streptomyces sp. P1-3 TaxID=3421658 RepID=UPI003D3638CB